MAIYIETTEGHRERVRNQDGVSDEDELDNLTRAVGYPYEGGWVQIDREPAKFVALRHVVAAEIAKGDARAPRGSRRDRGLRAGIADSAARRA